MNLVQWGSVAFSCRQWLIAAFTRGITCSAINCSERLVSPSSTQSMPA